MPARPVIGILLMLSLAVALGGCPTFLSDNWQTMSLQAPDAGGGATAPDAIAKDDKTDDAGSGGDGTAGLVADSAAVSALDSQTDPDSQLGSPQPDAGSALSEAGPVCTPLPGLGNNFLDCSQLSGGVYFDVDEGGGCNVNRTPVACMCAETFTCACITSNPTPYGLPICNSNNYTFQSCTVQANGIPLVTCQ